MSDKVQVHNHTLKTHGLPEGVTLKAGVRDENGNFTPGVTLVDAKTWAKAKEHKMVAAHLEEKHFSEGKLTAAEKKAEVAADADKKADAKK